MKGPENLRVLLCESERNFGDRAAFVVKNEEGRPKSITYSRLKKDAECFGTALIYELSLKGKKTAIMGENAYFWCLSYLALTGGVGVAVPLDKELPVQETENIISFAGIDAIICDGKSAEKLLSVKHTSDREIKIICTENINGTIFFDDLLRRGEILISEGKRDYFSADIDGEKTAVLLFTSGTTGMAKGVMLSHSNLISDLICVSERVKISEDDRTLSVLPLHHTYEAISFLMVIYSGASVAFAESLRTLKEDFAFYKPTVFVTVPLLLEKIHKRIMNSIEKQGKRKKVQFFSVISSAVSEEKRRKIFSDVHAFFGGKLNKIVVGAAALQKEVAEDFIMFGISVIIGYGLTECSPIVICNSSENFTSDSIGKPLTGVEVKIENPDEKGIGEICVKGPMVMLGYYKNKVATDEVMRDGFFYTGDLGYRDKNGNYHITGRKKNVIVTKNGKNIYPEEVEYYLLKNPVISDVMVYSEDDSILSAQIIPDTAEIERKLKKTNLNETEIHKAVIEAVRSTNRKLPSYKSIKKVTLRNKDFIRTSTKKIKREEKENKE
ncbi:MAG: AMP-binding protein [Clostridia bacterium]|nr:AMP-binding protein [Clostridia bacterium]